LSTNVDAIDDKGSTDVPEARTNGDGSVAKSVREGNEDEEQEQF